MDEEEYKFDAFDDGSSRMVGKHQEEKMMSFCTEYATKLREMEETLDASLIEVWDPFGDAVELFVEPMESAGLVDLVKTDNKVLGKVILVFSSLCLEMRKLSRIARKRFYAPFVLFGKEQKSGSLTEGDTQVKMGRLLPFLKELSDFVNRATDVVRNVIRQLASLYRDSNELFKNGFKSVHLESVYEHLGQLLADLSMLDEVCTQNNMLQQAWAMYKRMTKAMKGDASRYGTEEGEILKFEKFLMTLEARVFEGQIYATAVQQEFDFDKLVVVKKNKYFRAELLRALKTTLARIDARPERRTQSRQAEAYVRACALYGLYFHVFQDVSDKKLFKRVWDLHLTYPIMHVAGNVSWVPATFLTQRVQYMVKTIIKSTYSADNVGRELTKRFDQEFEAMVASSYREVAVWTARMESSLGNRADLRQMLDTRASLLLEGLRLAKEIAYLFKTFTLLHLKFRVQVKPSYVLRLCELVEQLKALQYTFYRRSGIVGESLSFIMQQVQFNLQSRFLPLKVRMESVTQKLTPANLDALASLTVLLQMLSGPSTPKRQIILRLCAERVFASGAIKEVDRAAVEAGLDQLRELSDMRRSVNDACNCSFMYWNMETLAFYFKSVYKNPARAPSLQYIFAALNDTNEYFEAAQYVEGAVFREEMVKGVRGHFEEHILKPLREKIEIDLRLQIHSHLKVSDRDPFRNGASDLSRFLRIPPLRLFDGFIDMRQCISSYLDATFYNLTTVALYDWKTYAEMRNLAKEKYGLVLSEFHLPGQTLEQGLDVLEIMRNIHIFVQRFNYNLNNQIFIEKMSESKSLNTINIRHIANSIRTHGAGIMNTTVNFTYLFLMRKFRVFSQFLYDDHIRSRLIKDTRFYRESRTELNNQYPFERADRFNKEIRRLGVSNTGITYLGKFRILITEIGNSLGYVRMIRSGGLRYISNAIKFVPDLRRIQKFTGMVEEEGLSNETKVAASNLDAVLENLMKNFTEGSEYFRILVKAFAKEFRNPSNIHLQTFYCIVPPLTINYVEYMLGLKDQLAKEAKRGGKDPGSFTDDGFAMGLVFILKLLNQLEEFDSLHWFQGTLDKLYRESAELRATMERKTKKSKEDGAVQSATMVFGRNQRYMKEFEMLRFSFNGARIFFRFDEEVEQPKEEKSADENAGEQPPPEQDSGSGGGPPPPPPPPPPM